MKSIGCRFSGPKACPARAGGALTHPHWCRLAVDRGWLGIDHQQLASTRRGPTVYCSGPRLKSNSPKQQHEKKREENPISLANTLPPTVGQFQPKLHVLHGVVVHCSLADVGKLLVGGLKMVQGTGGQFSSGPRPRQREVWVVVGGVGRWDKPLGYCCLPGSWRCQSTLAPHEDPSGRCVGPPSLVLHWQWVVAPMHSGSIRQ